MKKLLIIAAIVFAVIPLNAQQWIIKTIEADELKGTEKDSVALFVTEKYTAMVSFTKNNLRILSKDCVFDYHKNEYWIMLGIYDSEANLISKDRLFCYYPNTNSYSLIEINNSKHLLRKNHPADTAATRAIEHLRKGDGYIRIIAPMYMCNELDIILPCFQVCSTIVQQE